MPADCDSDMLGHQRTALTVAAGVPPPISTMLHTIFILSSFSALQILPAAAGLPQCLVAALATAVACQASTI